MSAVDVFFGEQVAGGFDVNGLQGMDLAAFCSNPSLDGRPQVTRHQRRHVGVTVVVLFLADAAAHLQRVAHPLGGQQRRLGAGAGEDDVGRHRGAVYDSFDGGDELVQWRPARGGDFLQAVDQADRRIDRRRQDLEDLRLAAVHDQEIRERPAHVDSDKQSHYTIIPTSSPCDVRRREPWYNAGRSIRNVSR
jgi:hypothetical protein